MSRDYPDWINPFKAAQARREFAGTVKLGQLRRLRDLIEEPGDSEVSFEVAFDLDDQREATVAVHVFGKVPMTCQRSLRSFDQEIDSSSVVAIIDSDAAVDRLPDDYEPLVVSDARLRMVDLVAEELLLALPLVPRAPDSEPVGEEIAEPQSTGDTHQPFAVLADLARKRN
jgi:uncharacterized protein